MNALSDKYDNNNSLIIISNHKIAVSPYITYKTRNMIDAI